MDYNLQQESCKMSLEHMTQLAIQYRDANHSQFVSHMNFEPTGCDNSNELQILRGTKVGPKECYLKHKFEKKQQWEKHFHDFPMDKVQFNESTKRKLL